MSGKKIVAHPRLRVATIIACMALISCAGSAPPIPEDTTATNKKHTLSLSEFAPADAAMDCTSIHAEQKANTAKIALDNQAIQSNRQQNEIAGYMAGIFILPIVATESNSDEKDDIAALQQRQDVLRKLISFKACQN